MKQSPSHSASRLGSTTEPKEWRGVYVEGPEATRDHHGEEIPVWHVYIGDEEGYPKGTIYQCLAYHAAMDLSRRMARDRKMELVNDAIPA